MNNGKVRIYELSKELNLDNKDIKEICDRLNIAVKSHSSTITTAQAERVKAVAAKQIPEKMASSNMATGTESKKSKGRKKPKQQILAVHHKKQTSNSVSQNQGKSQEQDSNAPTLAAPPKLPSKSQPAKLVKPTLPTLKNQQQEPSKIAVPEPSVAQKPSEADKGEIVANSSPTVTKPKLIEPPARQQDLKTPAQGNLSPTPSRNKTKQEQPPQKPQESTTAEKEPQLSPKPQKLKRPKPLEPAKEEVPETTIAPEVSELENDEAMELQEEKKTVKLKRPPTPPRKARGKSWEDEEEDDDKLESEGKTKNKGKRRPKPIVDDDDDFESELEIDRGSPSVSLSIARPPKPQSEQKTPAATGAKRAKKAPQKTEKTATPKQERRERAAVEVLPEKITLTSNLTLRELSEKLNTPETDIIKNLFFKGIAVNITQTLDLDTARLVAEELGVTVETPEAKSAAAKETEMLDAEDLENLQPRPPVVTIMGHVDHGKTTLLDSIRQSKVAQGEAGGITQHIGAYHVDVEHNGQEQQIVFLDTPGHEAFTAMRARGTRITDIAVLVVAADDGVQPQTREAISHAKAAEVPLVVAINKVDKPEANPDRIKQGLSEQGLVPEDWGGDTIMVPVSALKGDNLDTLLEMILLVAEIEELSANPDRTAKGTVIEAHLDRARGPVASLLVQNGTLRVGDVIVAGSVLGKIRAMIDDRGEKVEAATPSFAVEILGLNEVPAAGDEFDVYPSEKEARAVAEARADNQRNNRLQEAMSSRRVSLSTLSAQAQEGELKELNLILKADVQGSVEAILGSLQQLPQGEVQIRVLLAAPGEVTETDVDLAAASGAVIIGFNTTLASGARPAADSEGVDIRQYNIIYKLLDEIQGAMEGLLDPEEVEENLGQAEVRAVFPVGRGSVAGSYVQSGKLIRNCNIRVRRKGEVIYEGNLDSLKRIRDDVKEVNSGYECGIGSSKFNDWQEGDIVEAYEMVFKRRTLATK
ncbi:MAG: translation initiation factor IF-2 [Xenococcaceae cyanobacterium]